MDTQIITQTPEKVNRPARMIDALAGSRLDAARDAALFATDVIAVDEPVAVTIGGEPGEMLLTSYAPAPSPLAKAVIGALRELQPGSNDPGIVAATADHTVRLARRANLFYGIRQIDTRLHMRGIITTSDECRRALNHLIGQCVVEAITVREAYGQTHARLAYRLSPRVSCAELNTLIGDSNHD